MTNDEMLKQLTEVSGRSKSNAHRIDRLEKSQEAINSLAASVAVMAREQEHMRADIVDTADGVRDVRAALREMPTGGEHAELMKEIRTLKEKPGKRWEAVVEKAVLLLVGALMTWALTQAGIM